MLEKPALTVKIMEIDTGKNFKKRKITREKSLAPAEIEVKKLLKGAKARRNTRYIYVFKSFGNLGSFKEYVDKKKWIGSLNMSTVVR